MFALAIYIIYMSNNCKKSRHKQTFVKVFCYL